MTLATKAHFSQNINPHLTQIRAGRTVDGHGYAHA